MKKMLLALLIISILASFGCGKKTIEPGMEVEIASQSGVQASGITPQSVPSNMCIPSWELSPPISKNGFYGSGQAQYKLATLTRDVADARARQAIGSTLETKTASMVNSFMQQSGSSEAASTAEFAESVSKTVVVASVKGAYIEQRHLCPDGTIYSLAFYPFELYKDHIIDAAQEEAQNRGPQEKNLYDAFLAKDALERLDAHINSAFAE